MLAAQLFEEKCVKGIFQTYTAVFEGPCFTYEIRNQSISYSSALLFFFPAILLLLPIMLKFACTQLFAHQIKNLIC